MFKRCLLILSLFLMLPTIAGEVENALQKNNNVFLYFYTPQCKYCQYFAPQYNKFLRKYNSKYTFVKVDASTQYGNNWFKRYGGKYVPYVLLLNPKTKNGIQIPPNCLGNEACVEYEIRNFNS